MVGFRIEHGDTSDLLGTQQKIADGKLKRQSLNRRTMPGPVADEIVVPPEHDRRAVAFAIQHLFERQSMVSEIQLIGESLANWNLGRATVAGVKQAIKETPLLYAERDDKVFVTTPEVLAEEQRLIQHCLAGQGRYEQFNEFWRIEDETLTEQQRAAVQHILNSRDFVVGICGKAGTGKTILLHEAKGAIEGGFNKLMIFAPGSEAARDVLPSEGFTNAETVARLLENAELQQEARGAVWWVDEAGQLSTRQMDRLVALAKELEARVVLAGDTGQHHSVERGCAFRVLEKEGEMKVAQVEKIMRLSIEDGYRLYTACLWAGYNPIVDGGRITCWLANRIGNAIEAHKKQAPEMNPS